MIVPRYEQVLLAFALRQAGATYRQIAKSCGVGTQTAYVWLNNPNKYEPYIDEVAVMRAREGDQKVIDNLSVWERLRVFPDE